MFAELSEKFDSIFASLRNRGKLSEKDVKETMRRVRRALLEADVNYRVVKDFTSRAEEKVLKEEVIKNFAPSPQILRIVHDELTRLLGEKERVFSLRGAFSSVMVVGIQGSGKTTFCAKLGNFLRKKGRKPLLVALDIYRPAAAEQLELLGRQVGLPVYRDASNDIAIIYHGAVQRAKELLCDSLILDTAGRLHVDDQMMKELEILKGLSQAEEVLLVLDCMTGQEAIAVAEEFKKRISFTGIVLTKLDGDARGGAALSVTSVTETPIRFASTGEKLSDLEIFHPRRLAGRILGMGDMLSLLEKVQTSVDAKKAEKISRKVKEQSFNLSDFVEELRRLRKIGPVDQILDMIPGLPRKAIKGVKFDERQFSEAEAVINSMTVEERLNPGIINGGRRKRIAMGSGTSVQKVNALLKQFQDMKKMMKMMGKFGKGMRFPFMA